MAEKKTDKKAKKLELKQEQQARRVMLNELFNDWYIDRRKVYIMNFVRGILFGLGSVLGATLVIAILLWLLNVLGAAQLLGDFFVDISDTIEEGA